jgi:hypothetical protein
MRLNTHLAAGNTDALFGRLHDSVPGNCTLKYFWKSADKCDDRIAVVEK